MSNLKMYFWSALVFSLTVFSVNGADPVNKTITNFMKNCDCSYLSVKILDGLQTGEAQCICPAHTIKAFHVACASKSRDEIISVVDCANDTETTAASSRLSSEKKATKPNELKGSSSEGIAK